MNASSFLAALELPTAAILDFRVSKAMLSENVASTAADRRCLAEGVEECRWVATLKPTTVAVPGYREAEREYREINILRLTVRPATRVSRLAELVHRAVPYPVLLLMEGASGGLSLVHKRWSQNERGRTVLDGDVAVIEWAELEASPHKTAFLEAVAICRLPRTSLHALYQGWMDALVAFEAARRTGRFAMPTSPERAAVRRLALKDCASHEAEIRRLRTVAARERQIPRQVELNLELKRVEAELTAARASL